jgi:NAD(P)-dependent dehydrogenase (short-subunit alcohol dehydrogenase family)
MTDKITIVTGGGRGIGAATVARLAAAGHDVIVNYRSDAVEAEKTADVVRATGRRAITVQADISRADDIERLFATAATLGQLTGLVNNAGVTGPLGAFMDVTTDTFRSVVDINVIGYLLCAQQAARTMAISRGGAGGAIVNVSSGAATTGSPGEYVHYAAAKAAVDAMTIGLSKELGPDGIRVNSVQPGRTWTRIHADMGDPDRPAKINDTAPLRRAGQPDEVAAAIAWLLSDDASYTTGAILRVAGGL